MTMPNLGVLYQQHSDKLIRVATAILSRYFSLWDASMPSG